MGREKDQQAVKAVEDYALGVYTSCTRHTTKDWGFDDADLAKLRYNDSPGRRDGYLIASIWTSHILEYQSHGDDSEEWTVTVTVDVGFPLEPEEYIVYQAINGDWCALSRL